MAVIDCTCDYMYSTLAGIIIPCRVYVWAAISRFIMGHIGVQNNATNFYRNRNFEMKFHCANIAARDLRESLLLHLLLVEFASCLCPNGCQCINDVDKPEAICNNAKLDVVPILLNPAIVRLSL